MRTPAQQASEPEEERPMQVAIDGQLLESYFNGVRHHNNAVETIVRLSRDVAQARVAAKNARTKEERLLNDLDEQSNFQVDVQNQLSALVQEMKQAAKLDLSKDWQFNPDAGVFIEVLPQG